MAGIANATYRWQPAMYKNKNQKPIKLLLLWKTMYVMFADGYMNPQKVCRNPASPREHRGTISPTILYVRSVESEKILFLSCHTNYGKENVLCLKIQKEL